MDVEGLRSELLAWNELHARPLPARARSDPWAVMVLEVASQQTQILRAIELTGRFVSRFPSPGALAAATTADAVREWAGLGYYRRAVLLRKAAIVIVERHGGEVPCGVEELIALPGIGPYTARAIAVHAFGSPVAPLDTNIRRVAGRFFAAEPDGLLQAQADAFVLTSDPAAVVRALMNLAALVCRPNAPECGACPLAPGCASVSAVAPAAQRKPSPPFPSTRRWLRGELLRELIAASDWVDYADRSIGVHEPHAVHEALAGMASDGLIDLEQPVRARLSGAGMEGEQRPQRQ